MNSLSTLRTAFVVLLVFTTIGAFAQQSDDPQAPGDRNVTFEAADGTELSGYLALPQQSSGKAPAVLLIHEWWGLNNDTTRLADALAAEGYVVLAADAFRGSVAQNASDARRQVTTTPSEQIASDLDSALDFLKSHHRVNANRVASWGFCFGGTQSMWMGTRRGDLSAVVIFYGGGPITDAASLGEMKSAGPVLGIYGSEDGGIPVSQVASFQDALTQEGVDHAITVYQGVGHAFVKSHTYNAGGTPEAAWLQAVSFLDANL